MACHGFIVTLPEIYHEFEKPGVAFSYEGKEGVERGNELKVRARAAASPRLPPHPRTPQITKSIAAYDSDSAASVAWLASHPDCTGAVGVMGFCIGGHLAFRAAMNKGVRSAACFYATDLHKGSLGLGMNDNSIARMPELAAAGTEMPQLEIATGPEGGWAAEEEALFDANGWRAVSLGPRILRAETAALAALAVVAASLE